MNRERMGWRAWAGFLALSSTLMLAGAEAEKRSTTADLGGPDRYLTHVSTDKPIYRPGETVYIRAVMLHAVTRAPLTGTAAPVSIEIKGPKGDAVASGVCQVEESVIGFTWAVPPDQPGGEYTVFIRHPWLGHAPAERTFDVRAYRAPRLKSQIVFIRDGYGPGDEVAATLEVERAEGGVPAGAKVTATARVDGREVYRGEARVDPRGRCDVRFPLPEEIERGEGTLALVIEDGGVVETAAKTIPILMQTLDISFYPEGGDLVAGLRGRVYLEARTPAGKPADLAGTVIDTDGTEVVRVRTEHEGRGRFELTPERNTTYVLRITEPAGIAKVFPLPVVKMSGAVLGATKDRFGNGEPVTLTAASTSEGPLTITLAKREVEVVRTVLGEVVPGRTSVVRLAVPDTADGVLIATLWADDGRPLAERLVFRAPAESLRVDVEADRDSYVPGDEVSLTVKTTDGDGKPVGAVVGLTVTDDSVLEMIETREQAPRLPVMVLLESDVAELADAHVYLDAENPDAPRALDLLLGTQGWRRFAFVDTAKFLAEHGDDARRVLALTMVTAREKRRLRHRNFFLFEGEAARGVEVFEQAAAAPADRAPAKPDAAANEPDGDRRADFQNALEEARKRKQGLALDAVAAKPESRESLVRQNRFAVVRVYAHRAREHRRPGDRVDFTETLYWHTGIATDETTGEARVSFALSDSVTTFRVLADAFTKDGAVGSGTGRIESVRPFYVEPKLPLEVTMGDTIQLPVSLVNGTPLELGGGSLAVATVRGIRLSGGERWPFTLGPGARERVVVPVEIGEISGDRGITLSASAGGHSDRVTRTLRIVPLGFPVEVSQGGLLEAGGTFSHVIEIPEDVVATSARSEIVLYPTPLASLTGALERLLREPHGCFEQTSSTTYPLIMAQQYFMSHSGVEPALIERARGLLDKGYQRLISFECRENGYEWFGADPAHEALSAYGLLEFTDMSNVRPVDREMLERTRAWLLATRDGEGNFKRERRALHTWVADPDCSNGYILWSLLEAGEDAGALGKEIAKFEEDALRTKNSYVMALGALVASKTGDSEVAARLMDRLAANQGADGHVGGATMSIVGSGGVSLEVETTSLAVLAWLGEPEHAGNVEKAMRWIAEACENGRFGSTQSTVLALRAILAYDRARSVVKRPGAVRLFVDGHAVGGAIAFDESSKSAIELPDISEMLFPGQHRVELRMEDGSEMPFSIGVTYNRTRPAASGECKLHLDVELMDAEIAEGEATEAKVVVTNLSGEAVPTPVAIVGVPGGLEVRHDQLKELVEEGRIAAYEVIGREVVLYWRSLKPGEKVELAISFVAAVPGTYVAPASRAYLYYTDQYKHWMAPIGVKIEPAG